APPLIDSANAINARAFNQWLVNDWLAENNYTLANVAVFDFYNVLTGPDNHHRFVNGQVEHVFKPGMNTEYYPSGDDHPNAEGSRKATEEFLPLLNIFYHRWQASQATEVFLPLVNNFYHGWQASSAQLPPVGVPGGTLFPSETPAESGGAGVPLPPETSLGFGFDFGPDIPYTSSVWIDSIRLEKSSTYTDYENPPKKGLPCLGSILFHVAVMSAAWALR
ncbi:MAG TPA: hypothetical protein VF352_09350, partial [Anaerolineales bacterium]